MKINPDSNNKLMNIPNPSQKLAALLRASWFPALFLLAVWLATSAEAQTFNVLKNFNPNLFIPNGPLVQGPDNTLYGTASGGGAYGLGVVFKIQPDGTGYTVLRNFSGSPREVPHAGLVLSGNTLYGTTSDGVGTVFAVNTDGSGFTNLVIFGGEDPEGTLVVSGGRLYGTANFRLSGFGNGSVFAVNTDGTGFTNIYVFSGLGNTNSDGVIPPLNSSGNPNAGSLILSGDILYGTAPAGGPYGSGTVFAVTTNGTGFTVLHTFTATDSNGRNGDGADPAAGLTLSGNTLYGAASQGGIYGFGMVFAMNTGGGSFTNLYNFKFGLTDGGGPNGGLVLSGGTLYGTANYGGSFGSGTMFAVNIDGTSYTQLINFAGDDDGDGPNSGFVLSGNTLYGTRGAGFVESSGANPSLEDNGTVFRITIGGTGFATIYSFPDGMSGVYPEAGLVLSGNTLYGTTYAGGNAGFSISDDTVGDGTVFAVNTDGSGFTNLYNFSGGNDGGNPMGSLVKSGNILYGTTYSGGGSNFGTVFRMTANGSRFQTLYSFTGGSDGGNPSGGLVLSGGELYGAASQGGSAGCGTVFKMAIGGGGFTVLKNFTGSDGAYPLGGLLLSGSTLYGITENGSLGYDEVGEGNIFAVNTDGSGFTNLWSFFESHSGVSPCSLALSGGELYGMTAGVFAIEKNQSVLEVNASVFKLNINGGGFATIYTFPSNFNTSGQEGMVISGNELYESEGGLIYKMDTNGGGYTELWNISGSDAINPYGALVLAGSTLYGTTSGGGTLGVGTVFALNLAIPLNATMAGGQMVLNWSDPTYSLQAAPNITYVYTNVPGATSPFTNTITSSQMFFRLMQ
jgi:uncharacterized repeat protein (TIGR03803 family)